MLGRPGGYGAAYAAERDGLHVVVKLIHGMQRPSSADLRRLELVLARLTQVESPNVVPIIDYGIDHGAVGGPLPWIVMPRLNGAASLDVAVAAGVRIDPAWAVSVLSNAARGLGDLHSVGLLHRDFKPGNVLVDAAGRAWLIDFEILKVLDIKTRTPAGNEPLGTWLYMAPEQLLGPVGPPTDLWALGLVAHQLLTGRHPLERYASQGRAAVAHAIHTANLVGADVPAPYDELLAALLRKMPNARPQEAQHVVTWLQNPGSISLLPPSPACRPRIRLAVRDHSEVSALETGAAADMNVGSIDAVPPARGDMSRLSRSAARLAADLAIEPDLDDSLAPSLFDVFDETAGDPLEIQVRSWLARGIHGPQTVALLPYADVDRVGLDAAVHMLRVGARHRDAAGGRHVIGTIHCSAALLEDRGRAVPLLAACSAINVDGWRLLVDGVQPGCAPGVLRASYEAAQALAACGLPVWVRASGVARWALSCTPGVGLLYRAGRGLWTRPGGRPQHVDERVEVDLLAGPIPRDVAERLELYRPNLLRCDCSVCQGRSVLPSVGAETVIHNVAVVARQLKDATGAQSALRRITHALELRQAVAAAVSWHCETQDLQAVERLLSVRGPAPSPSALLLAA